MRCMFCMSFALGLQIFFSTTSCVKTLSPSVKISNSRHLLAHTQSRYCPFSPGQGVHFYNPDHVSPSFNQIDARNTQNPEHSYCLDAYYGQYVEGEALPEPYSSSYSDVNVHLQSCPFGTTTRNRKSESVTDCIQCHAKHNVQWFPYKFACVRSSTYCTPTWNLDGGHWDYSVSCSLPASDCAECPVGTRHYSPGTDVALSNGLIGIPLYDDDNDRDDDSNALCSTYGPPSRYYGTCYSGNPPVLSSSCTLSRTNCDGANGGACTGLVRNGWSDRPCEVCPDGKTRLQGETSCTNCPNGKYSIVD